MRAIFASMRSSRSIIGTSVVSVFLLASPACSDSSSTIAGGVDAGDASVATPPIDASIIREAAAQGVDSGGGGGNVDGATGDAAPPPDTCAKLGDVKVCKVPVTNADGVETCLAQPDQSLVWGNCVATLCDSTAAPAAREACVPAGDFTMGGLDGANGTTAEGDTLPSHKVSLRHRFYIDQFEATLTEFNAWWNATPRQVPADGTLVFVSGAGDVVRWSAPAGGLVAPGADLGFGCVLGYGNDPTKASASMNCVPYETALAYCLAAGKRLPSEAEWEYVATGQGAGNAYPWGATVPDDSCAQTIDAPCVATTPAAYPSIRPACVAGDTSSAHGSVNNLAGNQAEWTLDLYPPAGCAATGTCFPNAMLDPLATKDNALGRIVRGGSFLSDADHVRARARDHLALTMPATAAWGTAGFRCVRDER